MPGRTRLGADTNFCELARCRLGLVRLLGVSFFICQAHLDEHDMDGLRGAIQGHGATEFFQGHVGLLAQEGADLTAMALEDARLAPGVVVARGNVACVATLLDEFFDHAARNLETLRHRFTAGIFIVVSL